MFCCLTVRPIAVRAGVPALVLAVLSAMPAVSLMAQTTAPTPANWQARLQEAGRNPALHDELYKLGRKAAAVCAYCHGEGGNSVKPDVPNLAAQNPAYLLEQIHRFNDGRRKNVFMEGMTKALKDDEKVGVVLFFSSQAVQVRPPAQPALAAQGKQYYERVCFRCHGADGAGNEKIARIAGQQPEYLRLSLQRYRSGSGERIDPLMAANTKLMTDADVQAVVAYVSSMP